MPTDGTDVKVNTKISLQLLSYDQFLHGILKDSLEILRSISFRNLHRFDPLHTWGILRVSWHLINFFSIFPWSRFTLLVRTMPMLRHENHQHSTAKWNAMAMAKKYAIRSFYPTERSSSHGKFAWPLIRQFAVSTFYGKSSRLKRCN